MNEDKEEAIPEEIEEARRQYANDSDNCIEIDEDATVSRAHDGVWVSAWVWLAKEEDNEEHA